MKNTLIFIEEYFLTERLLPTALFY